MTVAECQVPAQPLHDLIQANRQDQQVTRYQTFAELARYCELSANPVGQIVLYIFGAATPERIALSDRICTALQLAEHWQDVAEDLANGRIYLPAEDLERFGVTEADLAAPGAGRAVRDLMRFETDRARRAPGPGRAAGRHAARRRPAGRGGLPGRRPGRAGRHPGTAVRRAERHRQAAQAADGGRAGQGLREGKVSTTAWN